MISQPELAVCTAEPIRIPGAIQPHGWLIAVDACTGRLVAYSENCEQLTGLAAGAAQDAALLPFAQALQARTPACAQGAPVPIGAITIGAFALDATQARAGALTLLELEPAVPQMGAQGPIYSMARQLVPSLQKGASVSELTTLAATEMKALTGFGRCLVYAFDSEGHGQVLAEVADAGYDSYSDHCFPATDIPAQARELYLLNHIRLIPDADYRPNPLYFCDPDDARTPVDLSFAQLRSVSPIHLEYMHNMGTLASMSVSIVVRGQLWGLIACHNHTPRGLDLQTRLACEHLGSLLSLQIEAKDDNEQARRRHELRSVTMEIVAALRDSDDSLQGLVRQPALLLGLAHAQGAAVVLNGHCWLAGVTPAAEDVLSLARWVAGLGTASLDVENLLAAGAPYSDRTSATGLLAISLSAVHCHWVIWFRPERVRTVRWAGEIGKPVDEQGRLHPRQSFKTWEQILHGRCEPWAAHEIAAVAELRQSLQGIVLHRAQERIEAAGKLQSVTVARDQAQQANAAKAHFLAVLSHELRTPLAALANATSLFERSTALPEHLMKLVPLMKRSLAIETRLIDDLTDLSTVSTGKLSLSLKSVQMDALVEHVAAMLQPDIAAKDLRLTVQLHAVPASVQADPVRMQQVLLNILRNAVKFTPNGGQITLASGVANDAGRHEFVLTCSDTGVGIEAEALSRIFLAYEQASVDTYQHSGGLGLGLAIARGIARSHGGELDATSGGRGLGATFTLRLPLVVTPSQT